MRSTVIVDTSIVIKWVLDEPDSAIALVLLRKLIDEGTVIRAPALLTYEVTNALYQRVRKGELTFDKAKQALADVLSSELQLNFSEHATLSMRAMELAYQHTLPATYDPHYLALAERENCEYWTADKRLWNAVKGKLTWARWLGDYPSTT